MRKGLDYFVLHYLDYTELHIKDDILSLLELDDICFTRSHGIVSVLMLFNQVNDVYTPNLHMDNPEDLDNAQNEKKKTNTW